MKNAILAHINYKIANTLVHHYPFPHIFIENIFPDDFYSELLSTLPSDKVYTRGISNYSGRRFADPTKSSLLSFMSSLEFLGSATYPFRRDILARFPDKFPSDTDLRLVRDGKGYKIGPHTDAEWKVVSYLFYLPTDTSLRNHGTSIYIPKDPNFTCPGGPHHPFDNFLRSHTAPFLPNSCFAFFKTAYSFHGVEPITVDCQRDVLLWNLYDRPTKLE